MSGEDVHVAAPITPLNIVIRSQLEEVNVTVHNISMKRAGLNPLQDIVTLIQLMKIMYNLQPNYTLGYTIKPVIYGTIAAKIMGVKNRFALITGLGYIFIGQASGLRWVVRSLLKIMYRLALKYTSKVFFQNRDDQSLFYSDGIIESSHPTVTINGSGVNLDRFAPEPLPQKSSFLMVARLLGDKGVREYAQAAQRIKRDYPDIKFVLVGWLDENPDTISQTELDKWSDEEVLVFLGKLSDVRPAITECSVYVLPSYREGTPRTVLEAMAMGRAIITTDAPGCRETVIDGENGLLVAVKSVNELEKAMLQFIENPSLSVSMGKRSRIIAEEKYDVHKVNKLMLNEMGVL